jgi:hypothetical protein
MLHPGHQILAKKSGCINRIIREATKIKLHPNIINREDGFSLRSWKNHLLTP